MNIVSITPYPPSKDGIADYSVKLQNALTPHVERATVISFERDGTSQPNQYAIISLNPLKWNKLYRTICEQQCDIVHLQFDISNYMLNILPLMFCFWRLRQNTKIICVATYHEAYRDRELYGPLSILFYRIFNHFFDRIFVHTSLSKQALLTTFGAPKDKVIQLPHGTNEFPSRMQNHQELRKRYDIKTKHVVLNFGYIYRTKGIEYVIQALALYNKKHPDETPTLLIAGKVPKRTGILRIFQYRNERYLDNIHQLVTRHNLKEYVRFIGYVASEELYSIFTLADATTLAYTSIDQSGVLNWAIEAHTPAVASDIGGIRETLQEPGILVPVRDSTAIYHALYTLMSDDIYRRKVQAEYEKIANELSTAYVTRKLVEHYKELL